MDAPASHRQTRVSVCLLLSAVRHPRGKTTLNGPGSIRLTLAQCTGRNKENKEISLSKSIRRRSPLLLKIA